MHKDRQKTLAQLAESGMKHHAFNVLSVSCKDVSKILLAILLGQLGEKLTVTLLSNYEGNTEAINQKIGLTKKDSEALMEACNTFGIDLTIQLLDRGGIA